MKPPPFLISGGLFFWGWQSDFLPASIVMAFLLEGPRWFKARWDFTEDDFSRIWTFCTLLFLAAAVYAFTRNEGPSGYRSFFENPNFFTQRNAGAATARTAAALFRWLPMLFFLFMAAQVYSTRKGVPLETISLILRRRWQRARKLGHPLPAPRPVDISYAYFALCLFAASVHSSENTSFFWGLCVLIGWALWPHRSRRFGTLLWISCFALAIGLGYFSQRGLGRLQGYLGNLNPQWFANFARRRFDPSWTRTELGHIGRLKTSATIVIRVETKDGSQPPPLLREATYREYRRGGWNANTGPNEFTPVHEEQDKTTYLLLREKTNSASVQIACYLDGGRGLLPLPPGSARLENLLAFDLQKSTMGAVLEQGPGLVVFDAFYGPGETIDSPATDDDTWVPTKDCDALDAVIAEVGLTNNVPLDEKLKSLNRFFLRKFTYSLSQLPRHWSRTNETPVTHFLLQSRAGHCEHFATAGVFLLRRAGIKARYAVGYAVHEHTGPKYVVRQRDAHAWCLVWNEQRKQWLDFDATPPGWIAIEGMRASIFQPIQDAWSRMIFEFSKFRWGQTSVRQYILWGLLPILVLLLYQIIARSRRSHRQHLGGKGLLVWPGLDSEFYQLERKLANRGLVREPSEPLSGWLERAAGHPNLVDLRAPLQDLLHLHYRYRFDPLGISPRERQHLRDAALTCLARAGRARSGVRLG